jgi:hypothetical protein
MQNEEDTGYHSFFMNCDPYYNRDYIKIDAMSKTDTLGER